MESYSNNNNNIERPERGSTGRRRTIEIKKIENKSSLIVTFSKRRQGLFRKASELCHLCDAEIAIITFSPRGRPYTFAHPSVESLIERFLGENPTITTDLSLQYGHPMHDQSKKRVGESEGEKIWEDFCIDDLSLAELEECKAALQALRDKAANKIRQITLRKVNSQTDNFLA